MLRSKLFAATLAIAGTAALSGCASLETGTTLNGQQLSDMGANVAHVNGSNWGLYLLDIPLITGSTSNPGSIAFGEDTVNVDAVVDMVTAKSAELGASKTADLQSSASSAWLVPTFVLFLREVQVSGNAVE